MLLSKLPPDICPIVSHNDDLDMDSLLKTFEQELIAQERASNSVSQTPRCVHSQGRSVTSAFVPTPPVCVFCQQSHSSAGCTSVLDLNDYKKIL